ncbi:hypothetical protein RSAG8_06070, partial [Rhizoctonia solani AG-8 WAC10335]
LPYQPRSASQLADSAVSNLRRSLTLQRTASTNSGQPDNAHGRGSREGSPVHAPAPRRGALSLEERLKANFSAGDGSVSPIGRSSSTAQTPNATTPVGRPLPLADPTQIPLPLSPVGDGPPEPTALAKQVTDPASIHLPVSPPAQHTHMPSVSLDALVAPAPRNLTLAAPPVAFHPLSPPPPESPASSSQLENPEPAPAAGHTPVTTTPPQPEAVEIKETPPRPPNIIVDVSVPSSALVTPSEFATAESRSDITAGSPNASLDGHGVDTATDGLAVLDTDTPITPIGGLSRGPVSAVNPAAPLDSTETEPEAEDAVQNEVLAEEDGDAKLRERLKVVEERFSGTYWLQSHSVLTNVGSRHFNIFQTIAGGKGGCRQVDQGGLSLGRYSGLGWIARISYQPEAESGGMSGNA